VATKSTRVGLEHNGMALIENGCATSSSGSGERPYERPGHEPNDQEVLHRRTSRDVQRGQGRGEAEGKGKALMIIWGHRGLATPIELSMVLFRRIEPDTLDRWLNRAMTVASLEEVFMYDR
jgi:hypothetical protein